MEIKSAGTYMQLSNLCKRCSKQSFCGNGMTDYFCTGYEPQVKTASDIITLPFTDAQKMVIEATERIANGKLICDVDDDIDVLTNEDWLCDYFNNEFRAMPTEKKAEVISDFILRLEELNCNKLAWMEWLKQPHKE